MLNVQCQHVNISYEFSWCYSQATSGRRKRWGKRLHYQPCHTDVTITWTCAPVKYNFTHSEQWLNATDDSDVQKASLTVLWVLANE